ncbi:MAG TPA: hypothetical protein VK928_06895 [Longimicrobiales bacterium]|nr:hypothetical protein [Longimicrobiales bacterium]
MTRCILLLASLALAACSTRPAAPSAEAPQRAFPDMSGRTVMLLPVQSATPLIGRPATADSTAPATTLAGDALRAFDAELAFWLAERAGRVTWVAADAVERAADRATVLNVRPRDLPIRDFLRARLEAIGDPLYGDLRGLSMLVDARVALLPIGAVWIPEQDGTGRLHVALALIDTFGGRVLWQGVIAGDATAANDAAALAAAAQAIAARVQR